MKANFGFSSTLSQKKALRGELRELRGQKGDLRGIKGGIKSKPLAHKKGDKMTIHELEQYLTRYAVPYSRITADDKKVDAEGSARKLFDKKLSKKQVSVLRLWLWN